MAQITYTNKVALNENPEIADINKVTDDDMNEIKSVVNDNYNNTIQITNTQPTDSDNKIWIDTGEVQNMGSELPLVYPVGSIYMSVNSTNPATLFGFGTWEQIQDTFLLAAGSTYTAGNTGGSATKTIAQSNLPSRTVVNTQSRSTTAVASFTTSSDWNFHCLADSSEAKAQPFDIMPPYLAVYMWKRTA